MKKESPQKNSPWGMLKLLRQRLGNRNGNGDGHADHRVVASAQEAHHLDVQSEETHIPQGYLGMRPSLETPYAPIITP